MKLHLASTGGNPDITPSLFLRSSPGRVPNHINVPVPTLLGCGGSKAVWDKEVKEYEISWLGKSFPVQLLGWDSFQQT
jgi:hypothetical protein